MWKYSSSSAGLVSRGALHTFANTSSAAGISWALVYTGTTKAWHYQNSATSMHPVDLALCWEKLAVDCTSCHNMLCSVLQSDTDVHVVLKQMM